MARRSSLDALANVPMVNPFWEDCGKTALVLSSSTLGVPTPFVVNMPSIVRNISCN